MEWRIFFKSCGFFASLHHHHKMIIPRLQSAGAAQAYIARMWILDTELPLSSDRQKKKFPSASDNNTKTKQEAVLRLTMTLIYEGNCCSLQLITRKQSAGCKCRWFGVAVLGPVSNRHERGLRRGGQWSHIVMKFFKATRMKAEMRNSESSLSSLLVFFLGEQYLQCKHKHPSACIEVGGLRQL